MSKPSLLILALAEKDVLGEIDLKATGIAVPELLTAPRSNLRLGAEGQPGVGRCDCGSLVKPSFEL